MKVNNQAINYLQNYECCNSVPDAKWQEILMSSIDIASYSEEKKKKNKARKNLLLSQLQISWE